MAEQKVNIVTSSPLTIVVIGGGAAGFFAAITAKTANPLAHVQILEATPRLLTKVKISGGGRCNVTHACFDPKLLVQNYPRGNRELLSAFSRFQPKDTVQWFSERGVALKTEADGRMFPISNSSDTIVNTLINAAKDSGVEILTKCLVKDLSISNNGSFEICIHGQNSLKANRVLLATGSAPIGFTLAERLGHTVVSPVPSLFTFNISDPFLEGLAGQSIESVRIHMKTALGASFQQHGPLLVTHWGLSGPAVLKLSAFGARALHESNYEANLLINFCPTHTKEEMAKEWIAAKSTNLPLTQLKPIAMSKRFWQKIVDVAKLDASHNTAKIKNSELMLLARLVCEMPFHVQGKGAFKEEFVTCGGISLKDVDFRTMESKKSPGLFFAGEILDCDGITGGFNFQNAWTTGYIAGSAIHKS